MTTSVVSHGTDDEEHGTLDKHSKALAVGPDEEPGAYEASLTLPNVECESMKAANTFLASLRLSGGAMAAASKSMTSPFFQCEQCGHRARLYCTRCCWSDLSLPPLTLGVHVHILRHAKEALSKSSTAPLPLLAPEDISLHQWSGSTRQQLSDSFGPGTWVLFPRSDAPDAEDVDWREVKQLVLIDSRWKHASSVASDPILAALPAMRLSAGPKTCFWRSTTETLKDVEGLVSTTECLHQVLRVRAASLSTARAIPNAAVAVQADDDDHCLDDILLFFALRLRLVMQEYADDPSRCCPWCTEQARRHAVHAGNARRAAQINTADERHQLIDAAVM